MISYPNYLFLKNAIFASQKCRFHWPKTMFSPVKNIVLDRSHQRPLPLRKAVAFLHSLPEERERESPSNCLLDVTSAGS